MYYIWYLYILYYTVHIQYIYIQCTLKNFRNSTIYCHRIQAAEERVQVSGPSGFTRVFSKKNVCFNIPANFYIAILCTDNRFTFLDFKFSLFTCCLPKKNIASSTEKWVLEFETHWRKPLQKIICGNSRPSSNYHNPWCRLNFVVDKSTKGHLFEMNSIGLFDFYFLGLSGEGDLRGLHSPALSYFNHIVASSSSFLHFIQQKTLHEQRLTQISAVFSHKFRSPGRIIYVFFHPSSLNFHSFDKFQICMHFRIFSQIFLYYYMIIIINFYIIILLL